MPDAWRNYQPPRRRRAVGLVCRLRGHQWAARAVPIALERAFCTRCGAIVPGSHAKTPKQNSE